MILAAKCFLRETRSSWFIQSITYWSNGEGAANRASERERVSTSVITRSKLCLTEFVGDDTDQQRRQHDAGQARHDREQATLLRRIIQSTKHTQATSKQSALV